MSEIKYPVATPTVTFTRLTVDDRALYESYYQKINSYISDLNFNSRMAWLDGFNYHKAEIEGALVIVSQLDIMTTLHFTTPIGLSSCEQLEKIVEKIWFPYADLNAALVNDEPHLRFLLVNEGCLPCYEGLQNYKAEIRFRQEYSDYLYEAEKMRSLKGKEMHAKRNHLNRFFKNHPEAVFAPLTAEDAPDALALALDWALAHGFNPEDMRNVDYRALKSLFEKFNKLNVKGGTLREAGKLLAFSAYSHRPDDCAFCHFEKAAIGYEDAYVAINALSLRELFPDVKWVNREEDLGLEGLRKAKMSYGPARFVNKYEVLLKRK